MKYSKVSIILCLIGITIAYMIFPPFNITFGKWTLLAIPIGLTIYLVGLIASIQAFLRKESGYMKYFSLLSIIPGILLILFLSHVFGGEI
ncbi:hypothetical protein ACFO0S_14420 [Chryseomicrobium palamuruense]|uniref:Uncharacterized protein n=1 Tax=Chryseomicrobium palamuruense TaxID=682973 RepID=A0ABV8UY67_9BACL